MNMEPHLKQDARILALSLVLSAAIFMGDLFVPLDVAGGVLYVIAVLVTLWHSNRNVAYWVASIATGFLLVGAIQGPHTGDVFADVLNRGFGLLAVWLTALFVQERRAFEHALKESEGRVRAILNASSDAIVSLTEAGQLETYNPATRRIFGYPGEDLVGTRLSHLATASYADDVERYVREVASSRGDVGGLEVLGLRSDGSTFPMHLVLNDSSVNGRRQITGIVRDVTAQRQLEQEVLRVADQDRRRVGHQLHEGLGQMLTGIGLMMRSLHEKLSSECHAHADEVRQIIDLLQEADASAIDLSHGLVPVDPNGSGLTFALERLSLRLRERWGVNTTFRHDADFVALLDPAVAAHFYQIVHEATTMLARHSCPRSIHMRLGRSDSQVRISIRHDGIEQCGGVDTERFMKILAYRARLIGAVLKVRTLSKGGVLTCTVAYSTQSGHQAGDGR